MISHEYFDSPVSFLSVSGFVSFPLLLLPQTKIHKNLKIHTGDGKGFKICIYSYNLFISLTKILIRCLQNTQQKKQQNG